MKISLYTFTILLFGLMVLMGCLTFRKSDKSLKKEMFKKQIDFSIIYDSFEGKKFRFLEMKHLANAPILLFVHGTPGSSTAFTYYFKDTALTNHFNLLIVDRPGYGYSDYGHYLPIEKQSKWINTLVRKRYKGQDIFLIGHSYGGPIVARAACLLDSFVKGTIMISPALDPENEKYFWFGKWGYWKGTRWMVSKALQVSATEKYKHAKELEAMQNGWRALKTPILHIHGNKDKLVPYINLAYSQKNFDSSILQTATWEGDGHLIPFTKSSEMAQTIKNYIESLP